jgi:hypothetical protein
LLLVTDSTDRSHYVFSGYPVLLDGQRYELEVEAVRPWEYGIEGWVEGSLFGELSLGLFDTMFFMGSAQLAVGQRVPYEIAALAYQMRPAEPMKFEIAEGPLWLWEREERLNRGETAEEASRPVEVCMEDTTIFLPNNDERCDEAYIRGLVRRYETVHHDGRKVYRVEVVVGRTDNGDLPLPTYVAERCLEGFVPRIGQAVEALVWIQGRRVADVPGLAPKTDTDLQQAVETTIH